MTRPADGHVDGETPVNRDVITLFSRLQALVAGPIHWGRDMIERGGDGNFNRIIDSDESFRFLFDGLWMRSYLTDFLERYPDGERIMNLGVTVTAQDGQIPEINLFIIYSTVTMMWNYANY